MSVYAGPEISQSGLIFAYDMGNTDKSWKGAPATNLITNPTNEVIAAANEFAIFADITPIFDTYGTGIYSISADIKSEVPGDITVYTASGAVEYNIGYYTAACESYYKRFYFNNINVTHTDPATTYSNLSFYGTYGTGRKPSIKNVQIEKNAFCTPFVNGTRTNSQAILDLIGLNAVTATSLTYNSNNTFSFNGSTNYITTTNTGMSHGTHNFSYSCWVKFAGLPGLGTIFENGFYTAGILIRFETNVIRIYAQYSTTSYTNAFSFTPTVGQWYHLVITRVGNNLLLYSNGILQSTITFGTSINVVPSNNLMFIGMSQHQAGQCFNGQIVQASVYSKALSQAEISQNFNALRGRFGI